MIGDGLADLRRCLQEVGNVLDGIRNQIDQDRRDGNWGPPSDALQESVALLERHRAAWKTITKMWADVKLDADTEAFLERMKGEKP